MLRNIFCLLAALLSLATLAVHSDLSYTRRHVRHVPRSGSHLAPLISNCNGEGLSRN
jgi:hypothetical protein